MAESIKSIPVPEEAIVSKIYLIREQKVMLDRDLAELYGVETKRLKEQENLRLQNATLKHGAHSKYLPFAFTEHGVLMLSNILKSGRAIEMSIKIIEVFVKLREMLLTHKDILLKLEQFERQAMQNSEDIQVIFAALKQLLNPPQKPRLRIGFRRNDERE